MSNFYKGSDLRRRIRENIYLVLPVVVLCTFVVIIGGCAIQSTRHVGPKSILKPAEKHTGPQLSIAQPIAGSETNETVVVVAGRTEAGCRIKINGIIVPAQADGSFKQAVELTTGMNNFTIEASRKNGESTSKDVYLTCTAVRIDHGTSPESAIRDTSTPIAALIGHWRYTAAQNSSYAVEYFFDGTNLKYRFNGISLILTDYVISQDTNGPAVTLGLADDPEFTVTARFSNDHDKVTFTVSMNTAGGFAFPTQAASYIDNQTSCD